MSGSDPVAAPTVTLVFKDDAAKREFLGQLSDGWGEQWVDLEWNFARVGEVANADVVHVTLAPDEDEEDEW